MKTILERFEEKYTPDPNTGCWLWMAGIDSDGYGRFSENNKTIRAHRVSYRLFVDTISDTMNVLHRCDTPPCVNPDHLFLGTSKENTQDMMRKNRWRGGVPHGIVVGSKNGRSKLTEDQVLDIRKRYTPATDMERGNSANLAKEFSIAKASIFRIIKRQVWGHI